MADTKQKSTPVKLRVTRRHHTIGGKTYGPGLPDGDTFMGTEKMLKALGDRLEKASVAEAREKDAASEAAAAQKLKDETARADAAEKRVAELEAELAKGKMPGPKSDGK